jgi:Cu(I)/Ag(I) efflux system membrane fusion protein
MSKIKLLVILILGVGLGFWVGRHQDLLLSTEGASSTERKPLYYRHPMNPQVTSPVPAKDEMGMDYVAVYDEKSATLSAPKTDRILYYRHPMGAADTSLVPKKDEMGMDYLPVYEGEQFSPGQIQISPEKVQKLGVRTVKVSHRNLNRTIRALGSIQVDESRVHTVAPKFEGWIQHLHVNTLGQTVKVGQPLFDVYSPDLLTAQQEYLIAREGEQALKRGSAQALHTAEQLAENALQRLHYWDIAPAQLKRLETLKKPMETLPYLSPVNGVVVDKPVQEGIRFMPGELLFRIADLSKVWLLADVFELDVAGVQLGQHVQVRINAYPERQFTGKVSFIYPTLATETRTVKVRVELSNQDGVLKPGLYGNLTLVTTAAAMNQLAVPDSAVIDSGTRQVVLLKKGEGRFEPRAVKVGLLSDGYYPVLEGMADGDEVVTHANFLIDAESNLKSALDGMTDSSLENGQASTEESRGDN